MEEGAAVCLGKLRPEGGPGVTLTILGSTRSRSQLECDIGKRIFLGPRGGLVIALRHDRTARLERNSCMRESVHLACSCIAWAKQEITCTTLAGEEEKVR